jgi:DNA end-binding protein Ku
MSSEKRAKARTDEGGMKRDAQGRSADRKKGMAATVWKGFISFGLVSFPVRLFSAARPETVHFHMLHSKDLSRVKEVWYCVQEDRPIERSDIVKGYETTKNEYVVIGDEELKKIAPPTATSMDILQFVDRDDVDPIFFASSYYVGPEDKAAKPYTLFMAALAATRQCAIAKIAMHNREHVVLIRPADGGLVLHTLYYPGELHRANQPRDPKVEVAAKELDLAKTLINHLAAPFKPDQFKDAYRENVERLIDEKRKGQKITILKQPRQAPVVDLVEALRRSLKTARSSPGASSGAKSGEKATGRAGTPKKAVGRHRAA